MCQISSTKKWALATISIVLILVSLGSLCAFFILKVKVDPTNTLVQTPKKYSKNSNRDLLRSGQESALATEQGRLWIKEVAASSEIMKIPKDIVIDDIYTPWSRWSRCRCKRKGAKQVRRRRCAHPAICGRNVIKEERKCKKSQCRNFKIVKRKKLSRRARDKIRVDKAFYDRWSKWSLCSDKCKTSRFKACRFATVCGLSKIYEEAYCYAKGSKCEKWHKEGKSLRNFPRTRKETSPLFNDIPDDDQSLQDQSKVNMNKLDKCGVQPVTGPFSNGAGSWAARIMGGRESKPGKWPWQVAIRNVWHETFCGGTIVAPGWVLTAAHCIRKRLFVLLGEHDLVIHEGSEIEHRVEKMIIHPDYNEEYVDNDVALLKFSTNDVDNLYEDSILTGDRRKSGKRKRPFKSTITYSPACLPEQDEELPVDSHCMIMGWGKSKETDKFGNDVLHEAEVPIVSKDECKEVYTDYNLTKNMFCAGYKEGRIDSCGGDSGGPLLCKPKGGRWTIWGITSFGKGCGKKGYYGIYAKVPNYISWIRSTISVE